MTDEFAGLPDPAEEDEDVEETDEGPQGIVDTDVPDEGEDRPVELLTEPCMPAKSRCSSTGASTLACRR
jgi:hypothetical protein